MQIYVRPWWHSSCGLHFKPAIEAAPDFQQAILRHIHQNREGQQAASASVHALNQEVVNVIDERHDHGHEKQDDSW